MAIELIIEDGSNVANANSFIDVAFVRAYAASRGLALPEDDEAVKALLIQGVDYLESKRGRYQGTKTTPTQSLQFPRTDMTIDGVDFPVNAIPVELKQAQARLAVEAFSGVDLMPTRSGPFVVEDTTGPLTTKYSEKIGTTIEPVITAVDALLEPLFGAVKASGFSLSTQRI